jgi:hypothetical protein
MRDPLRESGINLCGWVVGRFASRIRMGIRRSAQGWFRRSSVKPVLTRQTGIGPEQASMEPGSCRKRPSGDVTRTCSFCYAGDLIQGFVPLMNSDVGRQPFAARVLGRRRLHVSTGGVGPGALRAPRSAWGCRPTGDVYVGMPTDGSFARSAAAWVCRPAVPRSYWSAERSSSRMIRRRSASRCSDSITRRRVSLMSV